MNYEGSDGNYVGVNLLSTSGVPEGAHLIADWVKQVFSKDESLPDDLAVRRTRKLGCTRGRNDRKFRDINIIEEATRESSNFGGLSHMIGQTIAELDKKTATVPKWSLKI